MNAASSVYMERSDKPEHYQRPLWTLSTWMNIINIIIKIKIKFEISTNIFRKLEGHRNWAFWGTTKFNRGGTVELWACLPSSCLAKSKLYCGPNGPTASIFYRIWITQSVAMVFILNLDKVLLKKLFPTINIQKVRIFNIENRKCANVRKQPCTGLWKLLIWL